jgi:hypothetical protein
VFQSRKAGFPSITGDRGVGQVLSGTVDDEGLVMQLPLPVSPPHARSPLLPQRLVHELLKSGIHSVAPLRMLEPK